MRVGRWVSGCGAAMLGLVMGLGPSLPCAAQAQTVRVQRAHEAAQAMVALYDPQRGLFRTMGWWNSANAITELADESRVDPAAKYAGIFETTMKQAQRKNAGFLNKFYDDEGWWALAWIDVYELHGGEANLRMAESIFKDMTTGWDNACGGGLWWTKERTYKNAIPNELFLDVAAKLASHSEGAQKAEYLKWADREWRWFATSGMINRRGLINDGLDKQCQNNQQREWTYNQGVILAGLTTLSQVEQDATLLETANRIATAAVHLLTDTNGVLRETCEPECKLGGDGSQFKGIFVRDLAALQRASPNALYAQTIEVNAVSVWEHARTADDHFSGHWAGPAEDFGGSALGSALDVLTASAGLRSAP